MMVTTDGIPQIILSKDLKKRHVKRHKKENKTVDIILMDGFRKIKEKYPEETTIGGIFADNGVVIRRCFGRGGSSYVTVNGAFVLTSGIDDITLKDLGIFNSGVACINIPVISDNL